ncbi:type IV pilus modification PilV family protein [Nitrincola schmidtii]|uniref:type IV pilus modification PilV family protein n=1 Tax=Nitrincola schmidtii TaxID=1730894 RepID=UPI00124C21C4|nr:hypothetical protein [Nitrincola schmidtii]
MKNIIKFRHIPKPRRYIRGVTLIEALIALGIMVAGTAAIFGIHSHVTSTNTANRLELLSTGLAQEKIEELRTFDYSDLLSISEETDQKDPVIEMIIPGLNNSRPISLTRCWRLEDTGTADETLLRATVSIFNGDTQCNANNDIQLASLTTFIAQHDPRASARNLEDQLKADGKGKIIDGTPPTGEPDGTSGGFEIYSDKDGKVTGIYNPDTGQSLVPSEGDTYKFTQINGNLLIDDSTWNFDKARPLRVLTEGAAFCRLFYPNSNLEGGSFDVSKPMPFIGNSPNKLHYLQYSCIVSDGWRRSIYLRLPNGYQSCVGHPNLQTSENLTPAEELDEGTPDVTEIEDVLLSGGRQYTGYGMSSANPPRRVATGMRGSDEPGGSVIGSLCEPDEPCWSDDQNVRGWIPGGHHFFVRPFDKNVLCADSMEIINTIDTELGTSYRGILFRNPHKTYCSNDKQYTIDLGAPPTSDEQEFMSDCYSTTKVSGFMINNVSSFSPEGNLLTFITRARLDSACSALGAFGAFGGAYHCALSESVSLTTEKGLIRPRAVNVSFDPESYANIDPLDYLHDKTLANFTINEPGGSDGGSDGGDVITSCAGVQLVFNAVNSNNINLVNATFNSSNFSCNSSGNQGQTVYSCNITTEVAYGSNIRINVTRKNGSSTNTFNIGAIHMNNSPSDGWCQRTGLTLP